MEASLIAVISKLKSVIEEGMLLRKELQKLVDITREMEFMNVIIYKYHGDIRATGQPQKLANEEWIRQVHNLAYDIENCIDIFQGRVRCSHKSSRLSRACHRVKTINARMEFATEIKQLMESIYSLIARGKDWARVSVGDANILASTTAAAPHVDHAPEAGIDDLEGIDQPKRELLELLEETTGQQAATQLRVISIVGCCGLGKTALARAVYESDDVAQQFPCRAWVVASKYSRDDVGELHREIQVQVLVRELLREILRQVGASGSDTTTSVAQLKESLSTHLGNNRFFIVIDDIPPLVWETIKYAFPDEDTNGRIILTTSINSVAVECSSRTGYVYRMQALNEAHSKALFWKTVPDSPRKRDYNLQKVSECILKKCAGIPLAIIGIAQLLRPISNEMTWSSHKQALKEHVYLQSNPALERMKQVLNHSYRSLSSHVPKTFFLSLSMFPGDHMIKRRSLVRRWSAEGLLVGDVRRKDKDVADDYFRHLMDSNLINPVEISNNGDVKTFQIHGIMFDFIAYKSVEEGFNTLIHNDKVLPSNGIVRRLSFHSTNAESGRIAKEIDLSRIRSLSIFNLASGDDLVDFQRCKIMRVLDLENCQGLKDNILDEICELLHLRYLSLRGSNVSKIPRKISKLHYLETLDIRETQVNMLTMEVLFLPGLAYLFGRFRLPVQLKRDRARRKLQKFLSVQSELQSLAGLLVDDSPGFEPIFVHARKLRKVKIRCEQTPSSHLKNTLVSSLVKCFVGSCALESLSIDFGNNSIDFLQDIDSSCPLRSMKLQGRLTRLPNFITSSPFLKELCLSSTGLSSQVLSDLQTIPRLVCLKVVSQEFNGGSFNIEHGGFPSLQRLWIEAGNLPQVSIEKGGMLLLTSLQLLCGDVEGLAAASIRCLECLEEITLGDVSDQTRKAWEDEAKRHKNRPTIKKAAAARQIENAPGSSQK